MITMDDVLGRIDSMTEEDLDMVWDRFKARQREIVREAGKGFHVGQRVTWISRKRGNQKIVGTIERVNDQTMVVLADDGIHWKVGPTVVKAAKDGEKMIVKPVVAKRVPLSEILRGE